MSRESDLDLEEERSFPESFSLLPARMPPILLSIRAE